MRVRTFPHIKTRLVMVGVLSAACHLGVYAQDYGTDRGGWGAAAIGRGWAHFACDTCHRGPRVGDWDVLLGVGETRVHSFAWASC